MNPLRRRTMELVELTEFIKLFEKYADGEKTLSLKDLRQQQGDLEKSFEDFWANLPPQKSFPPFVL